MTKRWMVIHFPHLLTDWLILRRPELQGSAFVFAAPERGRRLITAASLIAQEQGAGTGMAVADAQAMVPDLQVFENKPGRTEKLLQGIGEWCIRYSPVVALHLPDSLVLDTSGCCHLWGGEPAYLQEVLTKLKSKGYTAQAAMADTIGAAWAISRYPYLQRVAATGTHADLLRPLPLTVLRLEPETLERLQQLGFRQVESLLQIPRAQLRRRFGDGLLLRLGQALGTAAEYIQPLQPAAAYLERLPCLEPICTATGIEIAIQKLLDALCQRLYKDGKGIRTAILTGYRVDGKVVQAEIGTRIPSHQASHLYKLFELHIPAIEPALGIELFTLEASKVEDVQPQQEALWTGKPGLAAENLVQLIDRIATKIGAASIRRYLPQEHHWPEWSVKSTVSVLEMPQTVWRTDKPRPTQLLFRPEPVEVSAPIPDYPPMTFRYQDQVHYVRKADGPERIEREWWLEEGEHRDYYVVEDQQGRRYWVFRSGHYAAREHQWFLHGFFA